MKTEPCTKCGKKSYHYVSLIGWLCTTCKFQMEQLGLIRLATQEYLAEKERQRARPICETCKGTGMVFDSIAAPHQRQCRNCLFGRRV